MPRKSAKLAAICAAVAVLVAAAPASAGSPRASASGEELLTYVTTGKLEVGKRIAYQVVCAANCSLSASSKLKLKGPDVGPVVSTATFPAGQVAEAFLKPNKAARAALRADIRVARLVTEVTATNLTTGEVDVDEFTYRFKK